MVDISATLPLDVKNCVHFVTIIQIDEVIGQAQMTRSALGSQRVLFGDVQGKVKQLGDRFPVIRGVIEDVAAVELGGEVEEDLAR
ncbi:hypothetical protein BHE74_00054568 [Ensete ventricosum]|nr:hypothetical protein GW17_00008256 [Ensete ventricosum]RWW40046.1 hypothetical protein BHE74_00054568 [Ensete ventricosum]